MSAAVWMLLTAPGAIGVAVPLAVEIGEGTQGTSLRRAELCDASADLEASAEAGATLAAEVLYREKYLSRHLVVRYRADAELFNVHGRSADLAFALALAAAVKAAHGLDGKAPPILAATGALDENGRVNKVEGVAAKLALALAQLPRGSVFVFPLDNRADLPSGAEAQAAAHGMTLAPVAQLEDAIRLLGVAVFRHSQDEFRLWQELSREAEQWSRGERALIPVGPQLDAARALYARHGADCSAGDERVLAYIRASLTRRDRRRVLAVLGLGLPAVALAGLAGRVAYDYVQNLHRTRITFDGISVPGPDYSIAAGPYLRRFGVSIRAYSPDNSLLLIVNNKGFYRGRAVDAIKAQNYLTQIADPPTAPLIFSLTFAQPLRGIRLLRAPLWPATKSGVTHPAWRASALNAVAGTVATVTEELIASYAPVPERWFELMAPQGTPITMLRVSSDFRDDRGRPFAGFQAVVIQEIQLVHD